MCFEKHRNDPDKDYKAGVLVQHDSDLSLEIIVARINIRVSKTSVSTLDSLSTLTL